jgi:hypothetical protein
LLVGLDTVAKITCGQVLPVLASGHLVGNAKKDAVLGRPFVPDNYSRQCDQSGSADFSGFLLSVAVFSAFSDFFSSASDFFSSSLDLEEEARPCPEGIP